MFYVSYGVSVNRTHCRFGSKGSHEFFALIHVCIYSCDVRVDVCTSIRQQVLTSGRFGSVSGFRD